MRVAIKGVTPIAGLNSLAVGGRFFPVGGEGHIVEVLEQEEDPPPVMVGVVNATTGIEVPTPRPDPDRMGKASLREIVSDGRFGILQLDQVDARAADAAVATMRREVQRLTTENSDGKIALAQVEATVEDAQRTAAAATELVAAHEHTIAELTDKLEKLTADHAELKKHSETLEMEIATKPAQDAGATTTPSGGPSK